MTVKDKEEGLKVVRKALEKAQASEEVRGKVMAVFITSSSPWWIAPPEYLEYLVQQLVTLFSYKFENERMSIPANMVYLMAAERGVPSILLHWRVYLSLYSPYVRGWRLETIKDGSGKPIGMVAIIIDKDGQEWRWERYYDNHALVPKWKNKELMFAKTILKEALAIMFPHLNLLPPLSMVETYDPDDLVDSTKPQGAPLPQGGDHTGQAHEIGGDKQQDDLGTVAIQSESKKSSADVIRRLAEVSPPEVRRERGVDAELTREAQELFQSLSKLVGTEEAKKAISDIVREHGADRFADLDASKKRWVLMSVANLIALKEREMAECSPIVEGNDGE
jgi:hypothetical protein